jgi:NADP-dependent 3-hydroxy acid dehydrogenase YdfG
MKDVIVITGASSGFGALTARALARAGHTVYASMRETRCRNAPQDDEELRKGLARLDFRRRFTPSDSQPAGL